MDCKVRFWSKSTQHQWGGGGGGGGEGGKEGRGVATHKANNSCCCLGWWEAADSFLLPPPSLPLIILTWGVWLVRRDKEEDKEKSGQTERCRPLLNTRWRSLSLIRKFGSSPHPAPPVQTAAPIQTASFINLCLISSKRCLQTILSSSVVYHTEISQVVFLCLSASHQTGGKKDFYHFNILQLLQKHFVLEIFCN